MSDFMSGGGFGMYPVAVFGLFLLAVSLAHALRPRKDLVPLIVGAGAATLLAGALGTAMGIKQSAMHIGSVAPEERWVFLLGVGESLSCLVLAFVLAIVATLLATAGSFRLARAPQPAAARA